jgi:hypothetical protein
MEIPTLIPDRQKISPTLFSPFLGFEAERDQNGSKKGKRLDKIVLKLHLAAISA